MSEPQTLSDTRRSHLEKWGSLYVLAVAAGALVIGNVFGGSSAFARASPTQYGRIMLGLHLAGFAGSATGYLLLIFDLAEVGPKTRGPRQLSITVAILAVALAGYAIPQVWQKTNFDVRPGLDEWLAVLFAFASLVAVGIAAWSTKSIKWRAKLQIIEIPLFLSLCVVIIGKWMLFDSSGIEFNAWITSLPYYPHTKVQGWEDAAISIRANLRAAFWFGIITGVVSVQLIAAQVAALGLTKVLSGSKSHS